MGDYSKMLSTTYGGILKRRGREIKIKEIEAELKVIPTKIKKLLSRYWQRGIIKGTMLPDYSNYRRKSEVEVLTNVKVGRPRKVNINNEYQTGINNLRSKIQFEHAINKYPLANNDYSLKDVYGFILSDFYPYRYLLGIE